MKRTTILLAEDERDLALIIRDTLASMGYRVLIAADGLEALRLYDKHRPDVVVTDVMMPRMDGFALVRQLRSTDRRTPILFLTARTDTDDVVSGFKMGANDYLRKPFSMRELMVRIESLLNRLPEVESAPVAAPTSSAPAAPSSAAAAMPDAQGGVLKLASFTLDVEAHCLLRPGDAPISLSPREVGILQRLFASPGRVVESHPLLLALWGSDTPYNARSLHVFISKLRAKLAPDPRLHLVNVHGVGYRLDAKP
ncbi:MAG: response regulator transcription factor [Bacteroidaceae bacterium]|nr:response regulator transcription factor [Bacteroidaceae bacterium]